ncbi:MAG: Ig-like domain-containing protein [Myxococcales bacterium]|nr:Ig-like domain-containing protein [Myxococcales bacterium]
MVSLALCSALGCGDDDVTTDGGVDGGVDGGRDGGPDLDSDVMPDADTDADVVPDADTDGGPVDGGPIPDAGIEGVRAATPGGHDPAIVVEEVVVTYVRPALGADPAGFFVQAGPTGPAVFVAIDPETLDPVPAPGDTVDFEVTTTARASGMLHVTAITGYARTGTGADLAPLVQDLSDAADLLSATESYESEYVVVTATLAGADVAAGGGHRAFPLDTAGVSGEADVQLRLAPGLLEELGLEAGCVVTVGPSPLWRFATAAVNRPQFMGYRASDVTITSCPAPTVTGASSNGETVRVSFSRPLDEATVEASDFAITGGTGTVEVTAVAFDGSDVILTVTGLEPETDYTVAVTNVADLLGGFIDGVRNTATFATPARPVVPAVFGDIIVSEMFYGPTPTWFELHNPSDVSYQLEGCVVRGTNGSTTITTSLLVEPLGYVVFGEAGSAAGAGPDFEISFGLGHEDDVVELDCGGVTIERISYHVGESGWPVFVDGASVQLDQLSFLGDRNSGSNWCSAPSYRTFGADSHLGTPGESNVSCGAYLAFSEYVYGTSNNKALEVANLGSAPRSLAGCSIRRYSNGTTTPTSIPLATERTLLPGETWAVCNSSLTGAATICDQLANQVNHNGDDAYDLVCGDVLFDVIGRIGEQPSNGFWPRPEVNAAPTATTGRGVIRRRCVSTLGRTAPMSDFDPSAEWVQAAPAAAPDVFGDLGQNYMCHLTF